MGGSQLKALKGQLRSSGLSRTSNPKDERKRAKQRKDLSSTSLAHRNSKLDAIHDKFNLFDVRDEKKKFEVVTRRGEVEGGKKGMPGRARAAGIETVSSYLHTSLYSLQTLSTPSTTAQEDFVTDA